MRCSKLAKVIKAYMELVQGLESEVRLKGSELMHKRWSTYRGFLPRIGSKALNQEFEL